MQTYLAVGIGDMMCIDSLMSQKERESISEIYWGCRFGKNIAPLIDHNKYYNVKKHHFISDDIGQKAMRKTKDYNLTKDSFWHFRPDIEPDFSIGKELFKINNITPIQSVGMVMDPNRTYQGSSFLMSAKYDDVDWGKLKIDPFKYILMHYPTSSRPRTDIAQINENDWNFIEKLSTNKKLKVIIITDTDIESPLNNCLILKEPPLTSIIALCKYAEYYFGCDSFTAILSCKVLSHKKLFIKTHDRNIYSKLPNHTWLKKYFLPHKYQFIQHFYRPEFV